ncbi:MAG TPA: hypothetical protein VFQ54_02010 [Thermomicrobiales bacterium]|nr:hypothetical protein [Thermomicrobiales bacterium]
MVPSTYYMQPFAFHREAPERLVVRDEAGRWYLWAGDGSDEIVEVPARLAHWMIDRREMQVLPAPHMWFERDSLPVRTQLPVFGD